MLKKIGLIILLLTVGISVSAQEKLKVTTEGDETTLSIAGIQLTFGDKASETKIERIDRYRKPRVSSNFLGKVRWGYNYLMNNDYFDLNRTKNAHFSMDLYTIKVDLDPNKVVSLATGVQFVYNDIVFGRNESIRSDGYYASIYPLTWTSKKSKLAGTYFGIPLYLNINASNLELSLMAFANYNVASFTRVNYFNGKDKNHFRDLNAFQYGVGASLSYKCFGIYGLYTISPYFRPGLQIPTGRSMRDMNLVSFGILFNFD